MAMVQYSLWSNCNGSCDFCLRKERKVYSKSDMIFSIDSTIKNLDFIDWEGEFSDGISILGGELFSITDPDVQMMFMKLIDAIIEKVLKVSKNPNCKFSTVTNGNYNPKFLFKVIDKIKKEVGLKFVDVNFSYDLKYRFKDEESRKLVLENVNKFHKRYKYRVGVQMILTQYVIDMVKNKEFNIDSFLEDEIPGNMLCFLYPHPVNTGKVLNDFYFKRNDFLSFLIYLKTNHPEVYYSFTHSAKNSSTFKHTGLIDKGHDKGIPADVSQKPLLSDGKEVINPTCKHSMLYKCYLDSEACMMCDIFNMENLED